MAVFKDETYSRAIFDLRWCNEKTTIAGIDFNIPSTQDLVQSLISLVDCAAKQLRFLHGDIRNWYYQIPISSTLGKACCLRQDNTFLRPTVLPMGYKHACSIAQSLMWSIILYRQDSTLNSGCLENASNSIDVPGIMRLDGFGFIALMYDSFLIVSSDNQLREWYRHLVHNFQACNVVAKYITLEPSSFIFTYCGIQIIQNSGNLSWKVDPNRVQCWHSAAQALSTLTPRTLFQYCGYFRHASTILGIPQRMLGRLTKHQSDLGTVENWDTENIPLEVRHQILSLSERIYHKNLKLCDWKMHRKGASNKRVFYAAVDATTTRWAVWPLENGIILSEYVVEEKCQLEVVLAEATAISRAIQVALRRGLSNVIIASDSVPASRAFIKGYSPIQKLDEIVAPHTTFFGRLIICDIPSQ